MKPVREDYPPDAPTPVAAKAASRPDRFMMELRRIKAEEAAAKAAAEARRATEEGDFLSEAAPTAVAQAIATTAEAEPSDFMRENTPIPFAADVAKRAEVLPSIDIAPEPAPSPPELPRVEAAAPTNLLAIVREAALRDRHLSLAAPDSTPPPILVPPPVEGSGGEPTAIRPPGIGTPVITAPGLAGPLLPPPILPATAEIRIGSLATPAAPLKIASMLPEPPLIGALVPASPSPSPAMLALPPAPAGAAAAPATVPAILPPESPRFDAGPLRELSSFSVTVASLPPPRQPSPAGTRPPAAPLTIGVNPAPPPTPPRHLPAPIAKPGRARMRWLAQLAVRPEEVRLGRPAPQAAHAHLINRTRADERFVRLLTLTGAIIILPSLVLGWRYLVPSQAQMIDRLVQDGRLKEAAVLANQMAEAAVGKGGPDYRFLAVIMLVEDAALGRKEGKALAFARTLEFARKHPADPLYAAAAINAMQKLGVSEGAAEYFRHSCHEMPPHVAGLWLQGLVAQNLGDNQPGEALKIALDGWDAAPGRFLTPDFLLHVARLAGKPALITARLRDYVVTGGHFENMDVYRTAARESGTEGESLATLWPVLMMRLKPADYADLARSIMACGATALPGESAALLDSAIKAETLPHDGACALIDLALSRNQLTPANTLVDKLVTAGCDTPVFLRQAARCKLWTNQPQLALEFQKRAYTRSNAIADFDDAIKIASSLQSTGDLVALCEQRGEEHLPHAERAIYAGALTREGSYERALRQYTRLRDRADPDAATLLNIARLQGALNRPREALKTYEELIRLQPAKTDWRDQEYRLIVTLGLEARAITAAERNWHDLADPRYLAQAMRAATIAEDSEAILRIALASEAAVMSADPEHLLDACYHLQIAGKNEPRIRILTAMNRRFPSRTDVAMELIIDDFAHGRFTEVERRFRDYPALAAPRDGAGMRISALLADNRHEAAAERLRAAINTHAEWLDNVDFAEIATHTVITLKDFETAAELTSRFLETHHTGDNRYQVLATRLLTFQGKASSALPIYAAMGDDIKPEMRLDYAWALASAGDFATAEIQVLSAIAESPLPDSKLFGALGDLRLSAGASAKAKDAYRRALNAASQGR